MNGRSLLIVDEHPLLILPSLAAAIGTNEAMFLQQLHYWLEQNPHERDGHLWVYNTISEWHQQFPFLSERTIRRTVNSLRDQGLIRTTDEYNRFAIERRLWYTIDYAKLQTLNVENLVDFIGQQDGGLSQENVDTSTGQDDPLAEIDNVDASPGQDDPLAEIDNVDASTGQDDPLAEIDNVDASTGQDDQPSQDNVADSSGRACRVCGRISQDHADISTRQDDRLPLVGNVAAQAEQPDPLCLDTVDALTGQPDRLSLHNMDARSGQPVRVQEPSTLSGSLYGTETTTEITTETTAEITTTTTTEAHDPPAGTCDPEPEKNVVVVLSNHGLSEPVARRFAQKYPQAYLLEKVEFLEFEKARSSNLANPAGWLRRAIENDFAKPAGFQSASEIEAQRIADAQREAAALETQRAEDRAMAKAKEAQAQAKADAEAEKIATQLASIEPGHGTTETLLRAWDEGISYVAQTSLGNFQTFMDGLRETVLLAFEAGHAKIGIWDGPGSYRFRLGGKQFLKECLAYAMRDTLDGGSGTYEVVLLGA